MGSFDKIDHSHLLAMLDGFPAEGLIRQWLKAGVIEQGHFTPTDEGVPQGGILSPLIFNVAMTVLDEHLHGPWLPGGTMSTSTRRSARRGKGQPTWRVVRYCDDFVVLVHGGRHDVEALREQVARVLDPLGLRLSPAKTRIVHMSDGFDFLGFHIQWRRKSRHEELVRVYLHRRPPGHPR